MDPFYKSNPGFNASNRPSSSNQRLTVNSQSSQIVSNATSQVPPNMPAPAAAAGLHGSYSSSYNSQGNAAANSAQYRMAAAVAASGLPMQAQYGGQLPSVPQTQQQPRVAQPAPYAAPSRQQQLYKPPSSTVGVVGSPAVNYAVPNPLGIGGAPSATPGSSLGGGVPVPTAPPTGPAKTDLLRSMYQSRQRQQQTQTQQQGPGQSVRQAQRQAQGLRTNYHTGVQQQQHSQGVQSRSNSSYTTVMGAQNLQHQQQQAGASYRQSTSPSSIAQPQQGVQQQIQSYQQQQRSPQMTSHQASMQQQQQQHQISSHPVKHTQQQMQQHQSNRMNVVQYSQQNQQHPQQPQQGVNHSSHTSQSRQTHQRSQAQQQAHSARSSSSQQQQSSQSGQKHRFHLTPAAKNALREAVLSAIRHPNGEVDPGCLQRAMAQGLPKQAIMNAAVVARQRDRRNREQRRMGHHQQKQMQQGTHSQQAGMQPRQSLGQQHQTIQQTMPASQQQHQQPHATLVHHPRQSSISYPPPTNVSTSSAKAQMQQMFVNKASNNSAQYGPTAQQYNQSQQHSQSQQQSRIYQHQQAQHQQAQHQQAQHQQAQHQQAQHQQVQQQQKLPSQQQQVQQQSQPQHRQRQQPAQHPNRQQNSSMTKYQRQLQAQQVNIAQQRKLQEQARKKKLDVQHKQEQQHRLLEEEKRKAEEENKRKQAAKVAAAAAVAKRKAELGSRMKLWGRTGFALIVKKCAKGLAPPQQTASNDPQCPQNATYTKEAIFKQSTWGGAQMCLDSESALAGALKRSMTGQKGNEELPKGASANQVRIKAAMGFIRKQLLLQTRSLVKGDPEDVVPQSLAEIREKRMSAISLKLLPHQSVDQLKRHKLQPKRESKFLDRHIRRARQLTADKHTKRHKELLKAIVTHQSEFYKFHRLKRNEAAKLARTIRDQHKKAEAAKEKEADAAEKARIAALRANDMAAYTSLLEDTKNERLKYLLDKTDECMNQISSLLASRVAEEEEDIKLMGGEGTIKATFTENVTGGSYYETAHVKSEQVRQPSLLVGGDLKEYQLSGLQWLVSLYNNRLNGILADEMGLGKTIQTISLIAYLIEVKQNLGPYLVIVPLSTLSNWVNEFAKWLPAATCICYKGTPQQRKQLFRDEVVDGHFNVLLTTYEFVIRDKGSLKKLAWQYAIVDEGHRMKNNQSKFAVTLGTHYNTRRRVLLTGTPLQNNLPELWALLNFLLPAIFNSAETFDQWFNKPFASFGKASSTSSENADDSSNELLSNEERMLIIHRLHELLRPFMLRRVKSEVLDQLPEKVEKVIRCELSSWQKELYKQISHKIAGEAATKNFNRGLNNVVMQLRKVCNHPYLFSQDGYHINDDIIRTSGKVELLDRMLPKLKAAGHRVLMFTQMTKMMPILEDYFAYRGFCSLRLDGSTTADEREKRMYMFNAPDSPYFIFLLSTRAGGLGLNLATADTVIIFDSDWNPMMDLQAQDRAHRIGQRKDVRVFRIITQSPVEEKILSRATEKLQMNELVVEAGKFDRSGQEKEDNSLERLKMMELLLTDFDQNQSSQGAATSEEDFDKDTDDGEEEDSKDLLNEMISSNDDDYDLYCKIDLDRMEAPVLYSDINDCPDWIRYPNGKPEEESELAENGQTELLGKRRAAGGDKVYDDGLTEKQFCRMMDKQASDEEKGKKKRKKKRNRNAVDPSLIIENDSGGRKRAKTKLLELDDVPSRSKVTASLAGSMNGEITAAMYDRLVSVTRSIIYFKEKGTKRKLSEIFLEKPCPQTYPDYYQLIDKPIGMNDILRKCRAKLYSTLSDYQNDWNTLFKNALTYNGEGSWIVIDAEVLRAELDRLMDKNALSASAAASKKPVRIKLSLKKGKKKKDAKVGDGKGNATPPPAAVKNAVSQPKLIKSIDSDDDSGLNIEGNLSIVGMNEREASLQKRGKVRSGGLGSRGGVTRLVRRSG